ncbi:hypothetical protein ACLESD_31705 [Pyxidicoccus sp. 3LFB2]
MAPFVLRASPRPALAVLTCLLALLLPASRAGAEPGIRILNSLATEDLALNALTTNRAALQALTTGPLNSKVFAGDERLKNQLRHGPAFNVMEYLVECALPEDREVMWRDPSGTIHSFKGGAGLCPEWESGAPGRTCLGYVTACLLARNNAYGLEVELSMRAEDPRDAKRFNPDGASVAWSPMFLPCPSGGSGLGLECGWVGEGVGTCTPGATVTVAAGAPYPETCTGQLGNIGGDRVLRVCEDPAGCARADRLVEADRNACGGIAPSATFTCPATGTYSVMSAPYSRGTPPGSWVWSQAYSMWPGTYPAAPFGAFTFREGAFYGNLFDPSALSVEVLLNQDTFQPYLSKPGFQGYPYQKVFACHSRDWVSGDSHLSSRICANTDVSGDTGYACLARTVGPCEPGSTSTRSPRCDVNDGSKVYGDGDFESCRDEAGIAYPAPVTTYLRSPCDLLPASAQQVCTMTCEATHCWMKCRLKSPSECLQKYSAKPQVKQ